MAFQGVLNSVDGIDDALSHAVQHVGVVRFNPFDAGGDSEFCARTDARDTGLWYRVSIREGTRLYANLLYVENQNIASPRRSTMRQTCARPTRRRLGVHKPYKCYGKGCLC